MTWKDTLKTVFKGFGSPDEVDPDVFLDRLHEKKMVMPESFNDLREEGKKELVRGLWRLAHQDELKEVAHRLQLYDEVADHYERFFEWEEDSSPGWRLHR